MARAAGQEPGPPGDPARPGPGPGDCGTQHPPQGQRAGCSRGVCKDRLPSSGRSRGDVSGFADTRPLARAAAGRASAPRPVRRHARGGREPHMRVRQARMRVLAVSVRPTSSPFAPPPISTFPGEGDHDPRPLCPGLCPTPPASGARTLGPVGGPLGGGVHGVPSRGGEGGGRRPGTNGSQCPWVARTQPGTACGRGRGALPGRAYRSRASCPHTGQEGGRRLALGGASSQESRWRNDRGRKRQLPLKLA